VRAIALICACLPLNALAATCDKPVYLTFDTGTMSQAELIAKTLKEENIHATFFLANEATFRGDHSLDPSWGEYWRRLSGDGHVFGNHTWSHHFRPRDLPGEKVEVTSVKGEKVILDQTKFCADFKKVEDAFTRDTGKKLSGMWRAPGGRVTNQTVRWAASCGYPTHVHWSDAGFIGDELPSDRFPNDALLKKALRDIKPGDVLLLHLGIRSREVPLAPILKPLVQGLKAKGFCFATLEAGRR
jgi:peptidoglycan/xylan/chitin deacetylase (PgdA/CDA1 family)